jgi:membrane protease YdiL (CAAX protease family)
MAQFWRRFAAAVTTTCRIVFFDCAGDIALVIGAVLAAFLTTNIAGIMMSTSDLTPMMKTQIAFIVPILTVSTALFVASLLHIRLVTRLDRQRRSLTCALGIGFALLVLKAAWQGPNRMSYDFSLISVLFILTTCVIAPLCEELFFRGYVWSKLRARDYSDTLIVFCTTILYIMPHVPNSLSAFLDYATIGLCLGLVCYFSGGILLSIVFHMVMNFIVVFGV